MITMAKNVYISAYEGSVLLLDLPTNFKRDKAMAVAYQLLNEQYIERYGRTITDLSNVSYSVNPHIAYTYEQAVDYEMWGIDFVEKTENTIVATYDEIKKFKGGN